MAQRGQTANVASLLVNATAQLQQLENRQPIGTGARNAAYDNESGRVHFDRNLGIKGLN